MIAEDRWKLFNEKLGKYIRCYARREVYPLGYCKECFLDETMPPGFLKMTHLSDTIIFHFVRALHLTGRCLNYSVCTRAYPMEISRDNAKAAIFGPFLMICFSITVLWELGLPDQRIFLSLEMRMKCGIGKCGRCNAGKKFVCQDGLMFTQKELLTMPKEY